MNESCHTNERVMSHTWMSPVTLTHKQEVTMCGSDFGVLDSSPAVKVPCNIWMSHVTYEQVLTICGSNFVALDYRVAKTHRMPYLYRSFSAKEPYNRWLFCEKWTAKIKHPMVLRHPVLSHCFYWRHVHESCPIWMSHVTYIQNGLSSIVYYGWVTSHMNESRHVRTGADNIWKQFRSAGLLSRRFYRRQQLPCKTLGIWHGHPMHRDEGHPISSRCEPRTTS